MITPRAEVLHSGRGEHGGRHALATGGVPVTHDFSACVNAFGAAGSVMLAIRGAEVGEYPDPRSVAARSAASRAWGRPIDEIILGAGAAELIQAACCAFVRLNDDVLIAAPAFGEYARASRLCGATVVVAPLSPADGHPGQFIECIRRVRPRIVFVAAPISPTGEALERELLGDIADECLAAGALLVIDQSYDAFAATQVGFPALPGHDAVVHLRSLTKEHAIAGVRVGFAVAPPPIAEWIDVVRAPWSTSSIAQAAAVAALSDDAPQYVERTTAVLRSERARIAAACHRAGFTTSNSSTHYLVVDVGGAVRAAAHFRERGILIRDCTSFGLPRCIRVAARTPNENDALITALESLGARGPLITSLPSQ